MSFPDEDDFHRLLDALTTCVLHDAHTKAIVWANRAACIALGFSVEELLPLKAPDMTRPEPKYQREIAVSAGSRARRRAAGVRVVLPVAHGRRHAVRGDRHLRAARARRRDGAVPRHQRGRGGAPAVAPLRGAAARPCRTSTKASVVTPHGGVQFISESGRVLGLAPDEALGEVLDYCSEADRDRLVAQLRDAPSRIRPRRSATGLCGTTARRAGCASCAGRSRSRTISSGCSCSSAT